MIKVTTEKCIKCKKPIGLFDYILFGNICPNCLSEEKKAKIEYILQPFNDLIKDVEKHVGMDEGLGSLVKARNEVLKRLDSGL